MCGLMFLIVAQRVHVLFESVVHGHTWCSMAVRYVMPDRMFSNCLPNTQDGYGIFFAPSRAAWMVKKGAKVEHVFRLRAASCKDLARTTFCGGVDLSDSSLVEECSP